VTKTSDKQSAAFDSRQPSASQPATASERKPIRNASAVAALKLERSRSASEAMKEHEAARQATLAKTARLRAERLARESKAAAEAKPPAASKKK
jgi:hypothetical protein